jgi:ArsR family transcriptional regulator
MTPPTNGPAHAASTARATFAPPAAATLDLAAAMLRAAGDAGRLRLLLRLSDGERCVTELADDEGDKLGTVSARLKQLHAARLVTRRREAKHVFYALADGHVARLLRDILEHAAEGASTATVHEGDRP